MKGIRSALALTSAERYISILSTFATLAIVSRILTPAEISISVLGGALGMLAFTAREFVTTTFLIQRKTLGPSELQSAFTLHLGASVFLAAALASSAEWIGTIYGNPALSRYLLVIAACLMCDSPSAVIGALLRRNMAFGKLFVINASSSLATFGLTITLALLGFSYMSFAWAWLASVCLGTFFSLLVWRDWGFFRPSLSAAREIVSFGFYNGLNVILYRLNDSVPYMVLGRVMSIESVALYNRSVALCQIPDRVILGGVGSVLLPAFASVTRGDSDLRQPYLRSIALITSVQWPALVLLAILAEPVVAIVLGDQWLAIVPLVRIMALAMLSNFAMELNYPVLVATGAMRDMFLRSVVAWPISAAVISAGAFFGLQAVAAAWLFALPFQAIVSIAFVRRHVNITFRDVGAALRGGATLALATAVGPLGVLALADHADWSMWMTFGVAILAAAAGWIACLAAIEHPLRDEVERLWSGIARARGWKWALPTPAEQ
jgi:O-antigen/teichoic acid export membrane protein